MGLAFCLTLLLVLLICGAAIYRNERERRQPPRPGYIDLTPDRDRELYPRTDYPNRRRGR